MKRNVRLSSRDLEHLVVTIETSLSISKRSHFFLWAQGALQGFIPHETLLCAHGDIARMRFKHVVFSRAISDVKAEKVVSDPANGLLPRLVDDWLRGGCLPLLLSHDGEDHAGRRQLMADLKRSDFGHVAAHGAKEVQGEYGSFFVLVQLGNAPSERDTYLLEMLMPYLHMALHRVLGNESGGKTDETGAATLLSKREIQVLHWVKNGKTNVEIGDILDIRAPTVKNHLQNIMRKLNVNNRAQAVGKSATLRLLAPGDAH